MQMVNDSNIILQEVFTVIELHPDNVYSLRNYSTEPFAYFHERRSLNNFHRDRVITFEQIAE
jgi:hypothetical protein